ncbi:MAG: inositol monophosphatase family protein, partial [Chloroflexota bacterium]
SFLNGKLIQVSEQGPIDESIVTLGDFASDPIVDNSLQIEGIKSLVGSVLKIKMFGAACYDFVALTCGLSDIHILLDFRLWDIMPGLLIAREAGVMFRTLKGNHLSASSKNLVGSHSPQLIEFVVSQFKSVE